MYLEEKWCLCWTYDRIYKLWIIWKHTWKYILESILEILGCNVYSNATYIFLCVNTRFGGLEAIYLDVISVPTNDAATPARPREHVLVIKRVNARLSQIRDNVLAGVLIYDGARATVQHSTFHGASLVFPHGGKWPAPVRFYRGNNVWKVRERFIADHRSERRGALSWGKSFTYLAAACYAELNAVCGTYKCVASIKFCVELPRRDTLAYCAILRI